MAKIGRNAPCPCGSGKKYKQCCLAQDEAARQTTVTVATPGPSSPPPVPAQAKPFQPPPPPPPDPHMEAINARWEAYEALDYEGRIALFSQTLDEPELMDDEMAFEMLNNLYDSALKRDERDRFDALITALRDRLPEVYDSSAHYYLDWQIGNARSRTQRLRILFRDLSQAVCVD